MPAEFTAEVEEFRIWSIVDYFEEVTRYSKLKGMENVVCAMLRITERERDAQRQLRLNAIK